MPTSIKRAFNVFNSPWTVSVFVCLAALFIRLISIGLYPLQDTSEARYGEMARLMVETGDWITVWFDYNVPFWGKPPLFIWLPAISFKIFGINEFAARLPSLLVSVGTIILTFKLALFQMNQQASRLVLIILPTSAIFLILSGTILAESTMLLSITMILTGFWIGWHSKNSKQARFWQYMFFAGCATALLAKGLAPLVIAGLPVFFWCWYEKGFVTLWKKFPWIKGSLLVLLVAAPWYIAAELKTPGFLEYFFIGEHFQRYLSSGWEGDQYGAAHDRPIAIIWPLWLGSGLPWSLCIVALTLKWLRKFISGTHDRINSWQVYMLLWLACPLIFFTFSENLIWTYALPVAPATTLLLANHWKNSWSSYRKRILAGATITPIVIIGLTLWFINGGGPKSHKYLMQVIQQQHLDNPGILFLNGTSFSSRFYSNGKAVSFKSAQQLQNILKDTTRSYFLATQDDEINALPEALRDQFKVIARYKDWTLHVHSPLERPLFPNTANEN